MAKRKSEVDDDDDDDDEDVWTVFVDTSLNTRIVLPVSSTDTISLLKQKILLEHPKCFPDFGEIQINALKVKRRECYYHLVDSMFVKTVFYRVAKNWFLFADVSSQICMLTPSTDHAVITTGPSITLPILVTSSKHLELGINSDEVDRFRNYSDVNKGLGLEMSNKIVSGVHDEFKSAEEAPNPENLGSGNNKKNDKKKRKRTQEHNDNGEENGGRPEDLPLNHAGKDGMKSTDNVADKVSPSTHAKKKHKGLNKDVEDVSLSKKKSDMEKYRSEDVDDLPPIGDSGHVKKRKKEKKHRSSELPSPKINKQYVQEGTQSHYQPEGTRTSSDKLVNSVIEIDNVELAPGSQAKKTKKSEKCDKMPDFLENDNAPSQNKNIIHVLKSSVIGSMELGTKAKKGKVSIQENTDLPSVEKNKDSATCTLSIGHVENEKNDDLSDKADRDDGTHQTVKKINRVNTVSIFSPDGDQKADDAKEIGAEPLQTAEINKPSVSLEIRAEKTKPKTQKEKTVSMKDSPDFSVKERSGEKTTEADTLKARPAKKEKKEEKKNVTLLPKPSLGKKELKDGKNPNAPKKAWPGYMFFSQAEREIIKKENPGITFYGISSILAEKWRTMSAKEKEPYEVKARADKQRYNDQVGEYKNPQTANTGGKDPNAPKKAWPGYMFFSQAEREIIKKQNPGITFFDISRILGEKWRTMSAEEKEPYEAKARADRQRYKDQVANYKNPQTVNTGSAGESN